jgi:TRAP-type mannitol/chloroaromatic compound transport system permease small subunit
MRNVFFLVTVQYKKCRNEHARVEIVFKHVV